MIINFGSLNIDYVYGVDHFVQPGETLSSSSLGIFSGGKGLNQSIAIARAGGSVMHCGRYGNEGGFLCELLKENGVDVSKLEKVDAANGHAIIQVEAAGENSILLYGGTNQMIDEKYVDSVMCSIEGGCTVLFQNETSSIAYAMQAAKSKGMKVAINPAPLNDKVFTYPMHMADILFVNQNEGQRLTGEKETEAVIYKLKEEFAKAKVILTLGANGAWFISEKETFFVPSMRVEKVVDTTAAGDTFVGYYLALIDKGVSDKMAMETATKAAAKCISVMGAASSIPKLEEIV